MSQKLLYGIPELASEHGEMVDHMLLIVTYFMAILFVFWSCFLGFAIYRFRRKKNPKANYYGIRSHWSSHVEVGVVIVEAVLLLGFAFPLWSGRVDKYPTGEDVVRLRAVGEKFFWSFHYPGADGKFGRTDPYLMTGANPVGLDPEDPNSRDDIVSKNAMFIPVHRPCVVEISAKDVIHNLHLYPMRIAQDAIPGTDAHIWFTPNKTSPDDGWDILCGQLCGVGHANMGAKLFVNEEEDFTGWLESQNTFGGNAGVADVTPDEPVALAAGN